MPLKLVKRTGAANFYIRGTVRGQGVFESTRTSNKEAAEAIRIKTEARLLDESIFGPAATTTFAEAADSFLAHGGSSRFLFDLNAAGAPTGLAVSLKGRTLASLSSKGMDRLAAKLYPNVLPSTVIRQFYSPLRAVWNHAVRQGWASPRIWNLPRAKTKGTNAEEPKRPRSGSSPTSYEKAAEFVAALSPAPAMVMTALFFTGMRPIELFALEADDVDVAKRWLVVRQSKTGEPRGVPVHEFLLPLLESLMLRGGKVFRTHRGRPYPVTEYAGGQLKSAIAGARARSGIKDISPYTARHTVSTQLVVNGVHQYIKDQILGHVADDMSRRYTHVPQKPLIEAINGIVVPDAWRKLPWWEDPLAWSRKLAGEQGKRNDLKRKPEPNDD